jgi:alkylation response protein AidB-like acyl-CoA dehydrogenase
MNKYLEAIGRLAPLLKQTVEEDEQRGQLSSEVIAALAKAGFYKLFLPVSLGGEELDPPSVAKLSEQLARHNVAAAWSIMVTNISNWFSKFLPAEVVEEIHKPGQDIFCAGTFAAPLFATRSNGGFFISGQTPLCSHVHEAQWITLLSIVMQDGRPAMNGGMPEMRSVTLKSADCKILDTWQSLGLKATDSNDVAVDNIFVPESHSFVVSPHSEINRHFTGALYRFPLTGISSCCLIAPVALAIGMNAVEALKSLTGKQPSGGPIPLSQKPGFQSRLAKAEAMVRSASAYLYATLTDCWEKLRMGETASTHGKAALLMAATQVNQLCTQAVDLVFTAAGTTGIYKRSAISRYFTDMQVIRQHGFANEYRFETAAQMILGLEPDFPPVLL